MKYIVIELQKSTEGVVSNIVTEHPTLNEAESKYFSVMAAAAVSEIPVHSAIIVSEEALPVRHEFYNHQKTINW